MLELLERFSLQIIFCYVVIFAAIIFFYFRGIRIFNRDIELLCDVTRILLRTGRVPPRVRFENQKIDNLWRKLIAFYAGVARMSKVKGDTESVISSAIDLLEVASSSRKIFQVLGDVILRSSSPESRFVAIAQFDSQKKSWSVHATSGINLGRLEDAFIVALDALPIEGGRHVVYASKQNGPQFDFSGLGVGISMFVPIMQDQDILGMVWIGFGEQVSVLDEQRRDTLELIIQHAVVSYLAAQKSEEKNNNTFDQKERILALSHDLKAPSVRALYALKELKGNFSNMGDNVDYLLNEIEYAIEEQLGYVGELFSFDAIDHKDNYDSKVCEIELASAIRSRVDSFRIVAKSVNLEIKLDSLLRARIKMPREVFNRILDNLISNAIKYTHSGYIKISTAEFNGRVEINIEDTGNGVSSDLVPFLFTAKMRDQNRQQNSGQGFGLSVVKKLLEDWGGNVRYLERSGGGALFSVSLPVLAFLDSSSTKEVISNSVLLVDDDLVIRSIHAKWIKSISAKVSVACSFLEAIEIMQIERPSVIITDVNIPGDSFYDFIQRVDKDTALVVLTAEVNESIHQSIEGLLSYIEVCEKPIERKDFLQVVSKAMEAIVRRNGFDKAA